MQGKDGYFLASLVTPVEQGAAESGGKPMDLVLWVDSSGSMGASERKRQRETVQDVVKSLGPDDRFRLVACDGTCVWMDSQPMAATGDALAQASQFLERRGGLGWTDLVAATGTVAKVAGPETQVVYFGDGLQTKGNPDSQATAEALEEALARFSGRLHVVAMGRATDRLVLRHMVRAGRGALLDGTGDMVSGRLVAALFKAMASPPEPELALEARGVTLGGVVELEGTGEGRRVWVGRFNPTSISTDAVVQVRPVSGTGEQADAVAQVAPFLPEEGSDNSLVVSLWARRYIDQLLRGPDPKKSREEVVGLSEEYGVLSPYTSFIVIGSDAERARFEAIRRGRMGDGKRFFAPTGAQAQGKLVQVALLEAQRWQRELRIRLAQGLSRPDLETEPLPAAVPPGQANDGTEGMSGDSWPASGRRDAGYRGAAPYPTAVPSGNWGPDTEIEAFASVGTAKQTKSHGAVGPKPRERCDDPGHVETDLPLAHSAVALPLVSPSGGEVGAWGAWPVESDGLSTGDGALGPTDGGPWLAFNHASNEVDQHWALGGAEGPSRAEALGREPLLSDLPGVVLLGPQAEPEWMETLVPGRTAVAKDVLAHSQSDWKPEEVALSQSASRKEWLAQQSGVRLALRTEFFDAGAAQPYEMEDLRMFMEPARWLVTTRHTDSAERSIWVEGGRRVELNHMTGMARAREAGSGDTVAREVTFSPFLGTPFHIYFQDRTPDVKPRGDLTVVTLTGMGASDATETLSVDRTKRLVVRLESRERGRLVATVEVESAEEVGGVWMPTSIVSKDGDGHVTKREHLEWSLPAAAELDAAFSAAHARLERGIVFASPAPTLAEARANAVHKKASDSDLLVLIAREVEVSRYGRALEWVEQLAAAHAGCEGPLWIRLALLAQGRRYRLAPAVLEELANRWLNQKRPASFHTADYLYQQASLTLDGEALVAYADKLKPLYGAAESPERGLAAWGEAKSQALEAAERRDEALLLRLDLLRQFPLDERLLNQAVRILSTEGGTIRALDLLDRAEGEAKGNPRLVELIQWLRVDVDSRSTAPEAIVAEAKEWVEKNTNGFSHCYIWYLRVLDAAGDTATADALARQWMEQAVEARGPLTSAQTTMLSAAIGHAVGWGRFATIKPDIVGLVGEVVYRGVTDPSFSEASRFVLSRSLFGELPAAERLQERIRKDLLGRSGAQSLHATVSLWDAYQRLGPVDKKDALAVLAALTSRAKEPGAVGTAAAWFLFQSVFERVAKSAGLREERLAFERLLLTLATAEQAPVAALVLFSSLTESGATMAQLDEASELIRKLGTPEDVGSQLIARLAAVDRLVQAWSCLERQQRLLARRGEGKRRLRAEEMAEVDRDTAMAVAGRLANLGARIPELAGIVRLKELAVRLPVEVQTADVLAEALRVIDEQAGPAGVRVGKRAPLLERARLLASAAALMSRDAQTVERLVSVYERLAADSRTFDEQVVWQLEAMALTAAADLPEMLERHLSSYVKEGAAAFPWEVMLASVLADSGLIEKAVELLERASNSDPLSAAGASLLSALQSVSPAGEAEEEARLKASLETAQEEDMVSMVRLSLERMRNQGRGFYVGNELLLPLKTLLVRAVRPQDHIYLANQAFATTGDPKVLTAVIEAVEQMPGQRVARLLPGLVWVFEGLHDQAALKTLAKDLDRRMSKCSDPLMKRQLALLRLAVGQSGLVLSGPDPEQLGKTLQAMGEAVDGETDPVVIRDILATLSALGGMADGRLSEARVSTALLLLPMLPEGSLIRLSAASHVANILFLSGAGKDAFNLVRHELDARLQANEGALNQPELRFLDTLLAWLAQAGLLEHAEEYLETLSSRVTPLQRSRLVPVRIQLYGLGLWEGTALATGKGLELVKASMKAVNSIPPDSATTPIVDALVGLSSLMSEASRLGVDLAGLMPEYQEMLLERYATHTGNRWEHVIRLAADVVVEVSGTKEALAFLLEAVSKAPMSVLLSCDQLPFGGLTNLVDTLLRRVRDLGELERPFLEAVLNGLRIDLTSGGNAGGQLYRVEGGGEYQTKHASEFLDLAMRVGETQLGCPSCAAATAMYIALGLGRPDKAVVLLERAHKTVPLQESGLQQLIRMWEDMGRYDKSVALAAQLAARHPDSLRVRFAWLNAAVKANNMKEAERVLAATVRHWKETRRWSRDVAGELGQVAADAGMAAASLPLLGEAITAYQLDEQRVVCSWLRQYLLARAKAELELGQNEQALDDGLATLAEGAVSGPDYNMAVAAVEVALERMKAMDSWLAQHEAKERAAGSVSPQLHSIAAKIYVVRNRLGDAIHQYEVALEAGADSEVLLKLLGLLKQTGQKEHLAEVGLAAAAKGPLVPEAAEALAEVLFGLGRPEEALRVLTAQVESRAGEAQLRTELASELAARQMEKEAVGQWEVAAELAPKNGTIQIGYAAALISLKQVERAKELLEKLLGAGWLTAGQKSSVLNMLKGLGKQP